MTDDADTFTLKAPKATDDGVVVAELAIARERNEIADKAGNVIEAMRSLRMPCDLSFLPWRELGIELLQRQRSLCLEAGDFLADGDRCVTLAHRAQFLDLGLQFGHRFFEVEIAAHWVQGLGCFSRRSDAGEPSKSSKTG